MKTAILVALAAATAMPADAQTAPPVVTYIQAGTLLDRPGQAPRGATTIIVAQRISTITGADQILVLEEGRIVGRGTHEELLESSRTYREIVDSQITVEETA